MRLFGVNVSYYSRDGGPQKDQLHVVATSYDEAEALALAWIAKVEANDSEDGVDDPVPEQIKAIKLLSCDDPVDGTLVISGRAARLSVVKKGS